MNMRQQNPISISPKFRKLELLVKNEVPTPTEIRNYHGPLLTDVFCNFGNAQIKKFLGVSPPLEGPGEKLWISPSDQLIGKVRLKRPLTDKCVKACTHEGILELSKNFMKVYQEKTEEDLRIKWNYELKEIRLMFEAEKRHEIKLRVKEIEDKYNKQMIRLSKEHEKSLEDALANVSAQFNKRLQKVVTQTRMNVTLEMMKKLRNEIGFVVVDLHNEYERKLHAQRDSLVADFNQIMRHEREKVEKRIQKFEELKKEDLDVLRVEMENKNIEDVMRNLRCQKRQYEAEKNEIRLDFEKKLKDLHALLEKTNQNIEIMKVKEPEKPLPSRDELWKNKIRRLFEEFQKFINFAFDSVPGQIDYLLSLESLLKLESDDDHVETKCNDENCSFKRVDMELKY